MTPPRLLLYPMLICLAAHPVAALDPDPSSPGSGAREMSLSLPEAVRMTLENNLDLAVERTRPLVAAEMVDQARGAFDPLGFAEYGFERRENPVASTVQTAFGTSGTQIDEDQWNYSGGFSGIVPFGLQYGSTYNFQRLDSTSGFFALERENRAAWSSQISLPLLRDLFHNEANLRVKRSRIAHEISEADFRRFLTELLVSVETDYWELAAARANGRVAAKSVQTAKDLLEQVRVQYEVGVVSKVRVAEAEAGVAEREVDEIRATSRAGNAQDTLLNTIRAPNASEFFDVAILPEDPTYVEYSIDERVAIEKAMGFRPELAAARKRVDDAEIQLGFARNQRLPRLDVSASYTTNGLSGPQKTPAGTETFPSRQLSDDPNVPGWNPEERDVCNDRNFDGQCDPFPDIGINSSASGAHQDFFRSGAHGWSAGVRIEVPIGNRTAYHRMVQRKIELRRSRSDLRRLEQDVILDVRVSTRALRSAIQALEATERRRVAQEETLRAEQERLRLGDSTPHNVLEFEEDLADAERQEILALQVYRVSIAALERAQGTLLETRHIQVKDVLVE